MSGICKKSHTCVIIRSFFAHFLFYPCKLCAQKLAQLWQVLDSFSVSWFLVRGTITLLISERLFLLSHSRHKHTHTHTHTQFCDLIQQQQQHFGNIHMQADVGIFSLKILLLCLFTHCVVSSCCFQSGLMDEMNMIPKCLLQKR